MSMFSSQHHSFDILLAKRYGVEEAILIHHFQHWVRINRANNRNIKLGRCWTYQTRKEILAHYPYWEFDDVRRLCEKLVSLGVLITANFNKSKMDKTLWYAFYDEKAFGVDEESSRNLYERQNCPSRGKNAFGEGKIATPIPDAIPDPKASDKKRERGAAPPAPEISENFYKDRFEGKVKITKEQRQRLVEKFGGDENLIDQYAEKLYRWSFKNPKKFKERIRHDMEIEDWLDKDLKEKAEKPQSQILNNRGWLEKLKAKYHDRNDIYFSSEGITFSAGQSQIHIKVEDFSFQEQVKNRLRKMNLSIEGL